MSLKKTIRLKAGNRAYTFGEKVRVEYGERVTPIAIGVWPQSIYRQVETGEHGVRYVYTTSHGTLKNGAMTGGAWVDKGAGRASCVKAGDQGVRIYPGTGHLLAEALGAWFVNECDRKDAPWASLVSTPGWHDNCRVYVNGPNVYGASDDWQSDGQAMGIAHRSGRAGSMAEWRKQASGLIPKTDGLLAALGLSLAGPLVGLLKLTPFGFHFCGDSSRGKSTTARFAASLWGDPTKTFQSWDSTLRALEGLADSADGACLTLDEIKRFRGGEDALSKGIHSICAEQGRARLKSDGSLSQQRSWRCSILSTGEVRVQDCLGDHYQGGHRVRLMDMWVGDSGKLTQDAKHAQSIERLCSEQHGFVSDHWCAWLVGEGNREKVRFAFEAWKEVARGKIGTGAEEGRISANLALVCAALDCCNDAGILDVLPARIMQVLDWLIKCLKDATGDEKDAPVNPNLRAWDLLLSWLETQRYRFPPASSSDHGRDVVGYRHGTSYDDDEIYTTYRMIKASGLPRLAGVEPRRWLDYLVKEGKAYQTRTPIAGLQRRWYVLRVQDKDQ